MGERYFFIFPFIINALKTNIRVIYYFFRDKIGQELKRVLHLEVYNP